MKSQGSPMGLMELRLMEGSPTSPTTLEGGTSGTNQAGPSSPVFRAKLVCHVPTSQADHGEIAVALLTGNPGQSISHLTMGWRVRYQQWPAGLYGIPCMLPSFARGGAELVRRTGPKHCPPTLCWNTEAAVSCCAAVGRRSQGRGSRSTSACPNSLFAHGLTNIMNLTQANDGALAWI